MIIANGDFINNCNMRIRIYAIIRGYYGERILNNIRKRARSWVVDYNIINVTIPKVIDDPKDFVNRYMDLKRVDADLLLYMPENTEAFSLLPEIMYRLDIPRAIAPVDDYYWLPRGFERQISEELNEYGFKAVFPRPFCSLSKSTDPIINEFAKKFGSPKFKVQIDDNRLTKIKVIRGTPCSSAYFVSRKLLNTDIKSAPTLAGLYTQVYPCLATHSIDPVIGEEMIHLSAELMKRALQIAINKALK